MRKNRFFMALTVSALLVVTTPLTMQASLFDKLDSLVKEATTAKSGASALTTNEVASGLKEALSQGIAKAVTSLSQKDGFLANAEVKIPLPGNLAKVESALRVIGQSSLADAFVTSMNRAAEQAVPAARDVFLTALQNMTLEDAKGILAGPDNAATQFFERTTRSDLRTRFLPLVSQATDAVDVTRSYKAMLGQAGPVANMVGFQEADLDGYVTDKGLDGLFLMVAKEEKEIRQNPVARTTALLKKVFGQ